MRRAFQFRNAVAVFSLLRRHVYAGHAGAKLKRNKAKLVICGYKSRYFPNTERHNF